MSIWEDGSDARGEEEASNERGNKAEDEEEWKGRGGDEEALSEVLFITAENEMGVEMEIQAGQDKRRTGCEEENRR